MACVAEICKGMQTNVKCASLDWLATWWWCFWLILFNLIMIWKLYEAIKHLKLLKPQVMLERELHCTGLLLSLRQCFEPLVLTQFIWNFDRPWQITSSANLNSVWTYNSYNRLTDRQTIQCKKKIAQTIWNYAQWKVCNYWSCSDKKINLIRKLEVGIGSWKFQLEAWLIFWLILILYKFYN